VSLVAILDADKEGFLRSERSLVQTIGRAARNLQGRAILYADKITNSMRYAIDETDRRRTKQAAYNTKHNITPVGIQKAVQGMIEDTVKIHQAEEEALTILAMTPKMLEKKLNALEAQMFAHAKNCEFEMAATIRDEMAQMKKKYYSV
jgi:excinuclease ABC subunit B